MSIPQRASGSTGQDHDDQEEFNSAKSNTSPAEDFIDDLLASKCSHIIWLKRSVKHFYIDRPRETPKRKEKEYMTHKQKN
jgi:hypothetical protein